MRTPARDAMLSHGTQEIGHGWGFGFHEAMDQTGAMVGPVLVAGVLALGYSYHFGFGILLFPALAAIFVLMSARRLYPRPRDLEVAERTTGLGNVGNALRLYIIGASLIAAGYADFPVIAYHLGKQAVVPPGWVPVLYAIAMGVDAVAALVFGYLFDKRGISVLILSAVISAFFSPLVFTGGFWRTVIGMTLWGIGVGGQECMLRAAIATLVLSGHRASAYGAFNAYFGMAWFLGSALMGYLYDVSVSGLIAFSVCIQLAAIPFFALVPRHNSQVLPKADKNIYP